MSARDLDVDLRAAGQGHLVEAVARSPQLRAQVESLDLALIADLVRRFVQHPEAQPVVALDPPEVVAVPVTEGDRNRDQIARESGETAIRGGEVALVLVAGGQGTRLGFPGPKGDFPFASITGRTLFSHHAAKIAALRARYGAATLPWYIMTSPENDGATQASFAREDWFGLDPASIHFLVQGTMPAVDRQTGAILLADADHLARSPDGHGGLLYALIRDGLIDQMREAGIRTIFTFQVDNPLVRIARPEFVGHHRLAGAEMSSVVVRKRDGAERMGVVARTGASTVLVEYSDLPVDLAERRLADGSLAFWAGSIAVHCIELSLIGRIAASGGRLPFHRAFKPVPHIDSTGRAVMPDTPNGVKFESFIFDALPLASVTATVEAERGEEFSPIKNAAGDDSPDTARRDLTRLYAGWLAAAGVEVPRDATGAPVHAIEIDPRSGLSGADLVDVGDLDLTAPILIGPKPQAIR